ncbi:MAG TPA: rhodanese-like domain-containing protein [Planctomycetota bacterium]|nr:rhodanese-like domain-containing protein [Planctomycetota bacterium]
MKRYLILGVFALALVPPAAFAEEAELKHDTTPLKEIKKQVDDGKAELVDCREQDEWDEGHMRDARFLPLSKIEKSNQAPAELPKDKPIYVHCMVGGRAVTVAKILKKLGYDARPIKAGPEELKEAGFKEALKAK